MKYLAALAVTGLAAGVMSQTHVTVEGQQIVVTPEMAGKTLLVTTKSGSKIVRIPSSVQKGTPRSIELRLAPPNQVSYAMPGPALQITQVSGHSLKPMAKPPQGAGKDSVAAGDCCEQPAGAKGPVGIKLDDKRLKGVSLAAPKGKSLSVTAAPGIGRLRELEIAQGGKGDAPAKLDKARLERDLAKVRVQIKDQVAQALRERGNAMAELRKAEVARAGALTEVGALHPSEGLAAEVADLRKRMAALEAELKGLREENRRLREKPGVPPPSVEVRSKRIR